MHYLGNKLYNECMKKSMWSNAVIKNMAYLIMLIDHFFATAFITIMKRYSMAGHDTDMLNRIRLAGKAVGRTAFILFAFLAVEGFVHTRSRRNYLFRLALFAVVSEIPFDLAFSNRLVDYRSQNVFFTLFFGVLTLVVWEWASENIHIFKRAGKQRDICRDICIGVFRGMQFGIVAICCAVAFYMNTDYKYMGVLLIFTFYVTREQALFPKMVLAGCVMFFGMWSINYLRYAGVETSEFIFRFSMRELYGLFAFIPIALYDGTRGRQLPKAVCYGFYPVHLLLLHGMARIIAGMRIG